RVTLGTAAYISPEQVLGNKDVDTRSDIYSMGVILYEFLTGSRPFQQATHYMLMNDHVNTPPPSFSKTAPGCHLPAEVERLVMRCLAKDPARRPASARAVAEAFLKATAPPVEATAPRMPSRTATAPKGSGWPVAVASGLALASVGGALAMFA